MLFARRSILRETRLVSGTWRETRGVSIIIDEQGARRIAASNSPAFRTVAGRILSSPRRNTRSSISPSPCDRAP
jgi:hypothetical protein